MDGRWFEIHEDAKPDKPADKAGSSDDEEHTMGHSRSDEGVGR